MLSHLRGRAGRATRLAIPVRPGAAALVADAGHAVQTDSIGHVAREDNGMRTEQCRSARSESLPVEHGDADHADGNDDERDERLDESETVFQAFELGAHG